MRTDHGAPPTLVTTTRCWTTVPASAPVFNAAGSPCGTADIVAVLPILIDAPATNPRSEYRIYDVAGGQRT
ncbi:MAG TPA: hypothetical protein VFF32_09020, partial [Dermatophilaceae bacterium]|nr:hypothetical protein [Dermatophilaceae bacterium]